MECICVADDQRRQPRSHVASSYVCCSLLDSFQVPHSQVARIKGSADSATPVSLCTKTQIIHTRLMPALVDSLPREPSS